MRSIYSVIAALFLLTGCHSPKTTTKEVEAKITDTPGVKVTFIVDAADVSEQEAVYIAGNTPQLGQWNPAKAQLSLNSEGKWQASYHFDKDTQLSYKFTKGSWDKEAVSEEGHPFANFKLNVNQDTTVFTEITHWKKESKVYGQITGTVKYHRDLQAEGLQKRDLIVWLPEQYADKPEQNFPVLYMHDGQNIIDPATSSFGHDWQLDETADSLIRNQSAEPFIIVGIYNTSDRSAEYLPGDTATRYMDFVVNTVKPLIDATYRTKTGREHTVTGGSSAGGILAFMLAWEHTGVFSKAICMSPAFKIQDIDYVDNVDNYKGEKKDIQIYVDNGGVGLEMQLQPGIDQMLDVLKQKGYILEQDLFWLKNAQAEHNEQAWAKRAGKPIQLFFGTEVQ